MTSDLLVSTLTLSEKDLEPVQTTGEVSYKKIERQTIINNIYKNDKLRKNEGKLTFPLTVDF